ncbi:hypothetical protein DH2020_044409 [Rehmannia glutinosa]|uniref:TF-B3 domain-containing protein n=1 Tax=Rehmannia glutinosa TaxID=99300 RepID=A0ABR0UI59_REHGL
MTTTPAFFKVFIAEINEKDLKIPPSFIRSLKQELPEKVYFKDRYNNLWTVKVGKIGDYWYFLDGWVKFARDNLLTSGDILVFEYYCGNWFFVKLFGTSATEKKSPFMREDLEKQDQVSQHVDDDPKDNDDDSGDGYGDDDYDDTEPDDNENVMGDDEEIKDVRIMINKKGGSGTSTNTRQNKSSRDCYGMEIFQAGLAQQPINPYFVTKVTQSRKADLFIPMDFIKDFNIDFTEEITLVDPRRREFRAKCKKWKDGRMVVTGGWRRLCKLNLVAKDDRCICEFVQGEDRRPYLNVSFIRGNMH